MSLLQSTFADANGMNKPAVSQEAHDGGYDKALLHVSEAVSSMESAELVQSELETIHEGLESIQTSLEGFGEEGLSAEAAVFMNAAVASHTQRLGLESAPVASLESFGGAADRVDATQVSMEGVKDTLAKIWKAIKEAVQKAIRSVADFFAKMFGGLDKVISKINAVKKKYDDASDFDTKAKFKAKGASRLHVGGKMDAKTVADGIESTTLVWMETTGATNELAGEVYGKKLKALLDGLAKADDDTKEEDIQGLEEAVGASVQTSYAKIKAYDQEISGGKAMSKAYTSEGKGGETTSTAKAAVPNLEVKNAKVKPDENQEVPAFDAAAGGKILDAAKELATALKGKKDEVKKIGEARTASLKLVDAAVKIADKGKVSSAWYKARARAAVGFTNRDLAKPINQLASHGFSVVRASISYCEANLSAATKGKKAEA